MKDSREGEKLVGGRVATGDRGVPPGRLGPLPLLGGFASLTSPQRRAQREARAIPRLPPWYGKKARRRKDPERARRE